MELDTLTTGDDNLQVNNEIPDTSNTNEVMVDETQDESTNVDNSISTEQSHDEAYAAAWDKVDLADDSVFDETFGNNDLPEASAEAPVVDPLTTTQETNNNIGAFMVEKPVLRYKGKDIPIDNEAELIALAQKGFQMETEAANMKPKKKALGIIDGVPLEVLQAIADIHGGNTDAISFIKSQYGIEDARSTDSNGDGFWGNDKEETPKQEKPAYTPEVKVEDPIAEFWSSYSAQNQQGAGRVGDIYGQLDESFKNEIYKPNVFQAFVSSVETGEFDKAYPIAIKEKSLNPAMTWLQAYGAAVGKIGQAPVKQAEPPSSATAPSNTSVADRNMSESAKADQVWNDDAYFKSLEDKLFA